MFGRRRLLVVLAFALAAIPPVAAQTLNPVVTVLPRATSTPPNGCDQSLTASPTPRVTPQEKQAAVPPPVEVPQPPPTTTLRGALRDVQDAGERNDRDAFTAALTRAASVIEDYPPGGEKTAAGGVLKVYNDILAFWNYQYEVATGAFFDASSRDLLSRAKAYPDYQNYIADKTIVDATGTRFYPTRETRDFLVREAASRLRRMSGGAAPAPVPQPSRPATSKPAPKPAQHPAQTPHKPAPSHQPSTTHATPKHTHPPTPHPTKHKASTTPAQKPSTATAHKPSTTTTHKPSTATAHKPAPPKKAPPQIAEARPTPKHVEPAPVTHTAAPVVAPAPSTTTHTAMPVTTTTAATQTTTPMTTTTAPTTTEATATTASTPTETTTSAATETTEPSPAASPSPSRRNLVIPIILILLGIGVLIVLFRASS